MGNCLKLQRAASWVDDDEWEEQEEMMAVEKVQRVEVTIRITKKQLQQWVEKAGSADGKRRQVEEVLAGVMAAGSICYRHGRARQWRPSLPIIPEAEETSF